MSKIERIKDLQKVLKDMVDVMKNLDSELSVMKGSISRGEFISEELNNGVRNKLDLLSSFQFFLTEAYSELDFGRLPVQIHSVERELGETLNRLEEDRVFEEALEFFLSLRSEDPEIEKILDGHKALIRKNLMSGISSEQLRAISEKYVMFQNIYFEEDARKKMGLSFKLSSLFEEALLIGLNFGMIKCADSEAGVFVEQADSAEHVEERAYELTHQLIAESCAGRVDILPDDKKECKKAADMVDGCFVRECPDLYCVEYSNRSAAKFSVKEFKRDIEKQYTREKIFCLGEAMMAAISPKVAALKKHEPEEVYEDVCNKLFHMGYLKKMSVDEMGILYLLDKRGASAFMSKDSASFINGFAKTGKMRYKACTVEPRSNSVLVRLLYLDIPSVLAEFLEKYTNYENSLMEADFFFQCVCDEETNDVCLCTSIVTEPEETFELYKEGLAGVISDAREILVLGVTVAHARQVAEWIVRTFENCLFDVKVYAYGHGGEELVCCLDGYADEALQLLVTELSESGVSKIEESREVECAAKDGNVEEAGERLVGANARGLLEEELVSLDMKLEEGHGQDDVGIEVIEDEEKEGKPSEEEEKVEATASKSFSTEEKQKCIVMYQQMLAEKKFYCATAYLKAASFKDPEFLPIYQQLAYALADPMEGCAYSASRLFEVYFGTDAVVSDYFVAAAALRTSFTDQFRYDHYLQQLQDLVAGNTAFVRDSVLNQIFYQLLQFKTNHGIGVDCYADYREKERVSWEKRLQGTLREAKQHYENYVEGKLKENASHRRFLETRRSIFSKSNDLSQYLQIVISDDREMLECLADFLGKTYIKDGAEILEENIDPAKINEVIDTNWELAGHNMLCAKHSSALMSSLRSNLFNVVKKVVSVLCNYVSLMQSSFMDDAAPGLVAYRRIRLGLLENIREVVFRLGLPEGDSLLERAGKAVLAQTLLDLESRLDGTYKDYSAKYFYIGFLKSNKVLLEEGTLFPVLEDVSELPQFSAMERICEHFNGDESTLEERLSSIYKGEDDDYGSARLIRQYLLLSADAADSDRVDELLSYDIEKAVVYPRKNMEDQRNEFVADLELAQSYGQIDNADENQKESMLSIADFWYQWALSTQNFGFFARILEAFRAKISEDAQGRSVELEQSLTLYLERLPEWENEEKSKEAVFKIRECIERQNYAAAEDRLNRLIAGDLDSEEDILPVDDLAQFLDEYEMNYKKTCNAGLNLRVLIGASLMNKDTKGASRLLDNWPKGTGDNADKMRMLLKVLGFRVGSVRREESPYESYSVRLSKPENGRKIHYKHPIAAFGSEAEEKEFRVVNVFGRTSAERLIDLSKDIGNSKHTIVFLDYSLTLADRRSLAKKTKVESTGKIFAVVDRVVLAYLIAHYTQDTVNRMLMSIIMPYAGYQPYIADSVNVMPPELFIGRKQELEQIESPTGVNIVYGGRQLGKSALLRMAKQDLNHDEVQNRAVVIDIKKKDYKETARKISECLYDEGILRKENITEDWAVLARDIKNRLREEKDRIPYLLLMLDEADTFIESCGTVGYQPFEALKDIQSIGNGRFKFVIAGLHNVARFNKNVALGGNGVLTHLNSLTVKPFKVLEARELLEIPLHYLGFRFPKNDETDMLVSTIFGTTNYFPGLIQLYCFTLIEAMKRNYTSLFSEFDTPPYVVTEEHIKRILAEQNLQKEIREKFFITLTVDGDDYYYILALLIAYHYHSNKGQSGCTAKEILELAEFFAIRKLAELEEERVEALLEEMRELNVLRHTGNGGYCFSRQSFCRMMGSTQQLDDELFKYMEE